MNEKFGIKGDGWNEEDLFEVMEALGKAQSIRYEIENCRRGTYSLQGKTLEDLEEGLEELSQCLNDSLQGIGREREREGAKMRRN